MFLINISVVAVFSLSSLFLSTLGLNSFWIGLQEHCVEGLSFVVKLFSGVFSDYMKQRKRLVVLGYFFTFISKPLLALGTMFLPLFFFARAVERMGNGIQSTPRDALIGDVAPAGLRGTYYGFQRGLGVIGSILGSLFAYLAMVHFHDDFQPVFFVASIPALIGLIVVAFFLREPKHANTDGDVIVNNKPRHPIHFRDAHRLGKPFWMLMIVVAAFWIARVTEGLLVTHAHTNFGMPKSYAPLIILAYNLTYSPTSFICGHFSDRWGRYGLLAWTMVVLMAADVVLFSAGNLEMIFIGILIWGVQMGMSMNLFTAIVADLAPEDLRGTALGCYYMISAVATFVAGAVNGQVTDSYGLATTYQLSMVLAGMSLLFLIVLFPKRKQNQL